MLTRSPLPHLGHFWFTFLYVARAASDKPYVQIPATQRRATPPPEDFPPFVQGSQKRLQQLLQRHPASMALQHKAQAFTPSSRRHVSREYSSFMEGPL